MVVNLDLFPLFFLFFLCSLVEILITRTMEDYRLIQIEEELEDEDDYDREYEEELIRGGIMSPRDVNLITSAGEEEEDYDDDDVDVDEEEEEDYEEGEEAEELNPSATMLPGGSIEDDDYDYEDEDDEYYEEEEVEVEELIPVEMISPRVSSSISHGSALLQEVLINDGLLDGSESCEGNQENGGGTGNGGKEKLNIGEIDGLFCPICFEAWTSGGDHQICCLPCGHIYGSSCIKKWLQQRRSCGKCPQCNNVCTLKDVRVLYATRLCVADEELHKRVRSLEAKCSYLEQKDKCKVGDGWRGEFEAHLEEFKAHRKDFEAHREEFVAFRQEVEAQQVAFRQEFEALRQEFEAHRQEFVAH